MGNDVNVLHGTGNDFSAFDIGRRGETSGTAMPGISVETTPPVGIADHFSNMGAEKNFDTSFYDNRMRQFERGEIDDPTIKKDDYLLLKSQLPLPRDPYTGKAYFDNAGVLPLSIRRSQEGMPIELSPDSVTSDVRKHVLDAFDTPGVDVVRLKNYNPFKDIPQTDIFQVKDPSQLRSRFAAFDQRRRNESDLLAVMVPDGLMVAASTDDDEAYSTRLHVTP